MKEKRIIFLGTPEIAAEGLEALILNGFNIVGVISQPDAKSKNRSSELIPSPVSKVALKYGIPLHRPIKLNKDYEFIKDKDPDLLLTYAYGQILSTNVLSLSKYPPLNVHASKLPKLRGASPIQSSLLNGDKMTAIDLMEMVKEMDAGRIFYSEDIEILDDDNFTSLSKKVSEVAKRVLIEQLPLYFDNKLIGVTQNNQEATFCHYINNNDEFIESSFDINIIHNMIRAFSMKPGAYVKIKETNEKIKIFKASVIPSKDNIEIGKIIINKDKFLIRVSNGYIIPNLVQKEGKKVMDYKNFINGASKLNNLHII